MTGNWSTSKEVLEEDVMPDFCCGFSYITSPQVGPSCNGSWGHCDIS